MALEQYLFFHRDKIWAKLKWTGKRNIPPVIAIYRKSLLLELDLLHALLVVSQDPERIQRELELEDEIEKEKQKMYQRGFVEETEEDEFGRVAKAKTLEEMLSLEQNQRGNQAAFWESEFLRTSLISKEFLELDYNFFSNVLLEILDGKRGASRERDQVLDLLENYLLIEDFKVLCYQLLPLVGHNSVLSFK